MTKSNNTKRALLASILSMALCVAMLAGSTFAWFTDSVTSGKNKIVAGNLDVEMDYAVFNEDGSFKKWEPVNSEASLFDENALWEPGYTQVVYLKVSNVGSLSLNYKLSVDVVKEEPGKRYDKEAQKEIDFLLSDYLKFGAVATDTETFFVDRAAARAAIGENAGKLKDYSATGSIKAIEAATDVDYVALVVYMPETVGNEANHYKTFAPEITFGIELFATQMVDEKDSFGNDYDKDAFQVESTAFDDMDQETFYVGSEADLLKLADVVLTNDFNGKVITLADDITLAQENWKAIGTDSAPFKGTFDGNGHTISGLNITKSENSYAGLFGVIENATIQNLTVAGDIVINSSSVKTIGGICANAKSSTISSCVNNVNIDVTGFDLAEGDTESAVVGGIVGVISGTITDCTNKGNITANDAVDYYAILAGGISSSSLYGVTWSNCENEGTITGNPYMVGNLFANEQSN